MKKLFLIIASMLAASSSAFAAPSDGVPFTHIFYQTLNFGGLSIILFFILRNPVKEMFAARKKDFEASLAKAQAIKNEAEATRSLVLEKIKKLELGFNEEIKKAELGAQKTKDEIIASAKINAEKIKHDVERIYSNEIATAMKNLKEDFLNESIFTAKKMIQEQMKEKDHHSLQENLIKNIGAAK